MSGTRALFASIGASVSIVAAAALSLLAVSAVFAFGGWSDPMVESIAETSIVLPSATVAAELKRAPVVLAAARKRHPRSSGTHEARRARPAPPDTAPVVAAQRAQPTPPPPPAVATVPQEPPAPAAPAPAAAKSHSSVGDAVRSAGEDLTATVQGAGDALAAATQPLAPPVSSAVQLVVNIVANLLRRATDGLGGVVDGVLPAK